MVEWEGSDHEAACTYLFAIIRDVTEPIIEVENAAVAEGLERMYSHPVVQRLQTDTTKKHHFDNTDCSLICLHANF